MATVTGLTANRMLQIEAGSIIGARKVGNYLILTTHGGVDINVGSVIGPDGPIGPDGVAGPIGLTGMDGITGLPGSDGAPTYTWIKYADSPIAGMSDVPDGKNYMGIANNKTSPTESSLYSDYSWSLTTGAQGVPGASGSDGQRMYTWIKYASSSMGADLRDDPTGMAYIGLAYNKLTVLESTTATDYSWHLFQGPEGAAGTDAVLLRVASSRGTSFKNNSISTVLSVTVFKGDLRITTIQDLQANFSGSAYLEWWWRRMNDISFSVVSSADSRLSQAGFALTVSPLDVDQQSVFECRLQT